MRKANTGFVVSWRLCGFARAGFDFEFPKRGGCGVLFYAESGLKPGFGLIPKGKGEGKAIRKGMRKANTGFVVSWRLCGFTQAGFDFEFPKRGGGYEE